MLPQFLCSTHLFSESLIKQVNDYFAKIGKVVTITRKFRPRKKIWGNSNQIKHRFLESCHLFDVHASISPANILVQFGFVTLIVKIYSIFLCRAGLQVFKFFCAFLQTKHQTDLCKKKKEKKLKVHPYIIQIQNTEIDFPLAPNLELC